MFQIPWACQHCRAWCAAARLHRDRKARNTWKETSLRLAKIRRASSDDGARFGEASAACGSRRDLGSTPAVSRDSANRRRFGFWPEPRLRQNEGSRVWKSDSGSGRMIAVMRRAAAPDPRLRAIGALNASVRSTLNFGVCATGPTDGRRHEPRRRSWAGFAPGEPHRPNHAPATKCRFAEPTAARRRRTGGQERTCLKRV